MATLGIDDLLHNPGVLIFRLFMHEFRRASRPLNEDNRLLNFPRIKRPDDFRHTLRIVVEVDGRPRLCSVGSSISRDCFEFRPLPSEAHTHEVAACFPRRIRLPGRKKIFTANAHVPTGGLSVRMLFAASPEVRSLADTVPHNLLRVPTCLMLLQM